MTDKNIRALYGLKYNPFLGAVNKLTLQIHS